MALKQRDNRTLSDLIGLKRRLEREFGELRPPANGTSTPTAPPDTPREEPTPDGRARREARCINCGYDQKGVRPTRCPECGLPMAAFYRDPTRWSDARAGAGAWWATAVEVWTWQRRLRVRASMMPATPGARVFSFWAAAMAAILLGLTLAIADSLTPTPGGFGPLAFALRFVWAAAAVSVLLFGSLYGLAWSLRGTWRKRYPFVPGSVHYATAWWPLVAGSLLILTALYAYAPETELLVLIGFAGIGGAAAWSLWLWSSLDEAERVSLPSLRIGAAVLVMSILGSLVAALLPSATQWSLGQFVAKQGGLAKVKILGSLQSGFTSAGPRTYAVIIDMFDMIRESPVPEIASQLGADQADQVCMYGKDANFANIRKTFETLSSEIRPQDRLLLYIAGHGAKEGAGVIEVDDGFVTSQKLAEWVGGLNTLNNLVVIDSCYGGKFIKALRREYVNAVVVTSSDRQNVAFSPVLDPFWNAWLHSDTEAAADGRVTVAEAYDMALRTMLKVGDRARENIANNGDDREVRLMEESGDCTPQYDVLGKADEKVFFIPASDDSTQKGSQPKPD